jgi:tetratricopeptide (TPR) repeat protein
MKRKNLSLSVRDYHSLHWLMYAYLQQGRYAKATELLALMKKVMSESTYDNKLRPDYYENNYANMAAALIVETEQWNLADELFPVAKMAPETASPEAAMGGSHAGHGAAAPAANTTRYSNASRNLPPFIRGLAAAMRGASDLEPDPGKVRELEVAALNASMKKDHAKAIELMKKATALEEQAPPPSGPPSLIKPTHELYGEILLRADKFVEASEQFRIALLRQPNRARSLLGAARAAARAGNQISAAASYKKLLEQWKQADTGLPELREARAFLDTRTSIARGN